MVLVKATLGLLSVLARLVCFVESCMGMQSAVALPQMCVWAVQRSHLHANTFASQLSACLLFGLA